MKKKKPNSVFKIDSVYEGDCLQVMDTWANELIDLVYLDPPFFSQSEQSLSSRTGQNSYKFEDRWTSQTEYLNYMRERLTLIRKKLKSTGSLFLHCDRHSSHYLKVLLDEIFGAENFQSEIIWTYRRWSNAKKGLLNNHQVIFFYSKSSEFKFKQKFENYSPTTNLDQIVQLRERDHRNKTVYRKDSSGRPILADHKIGVPMGDVWEIPYLNPKAKERVGYPTQKPLVLLERIIELVTDEGDLVVDPFCGSGSMAVGAKLLNRRFAAIDKSSSAIELTQQRLNRPVRTTSALMSKGRAAYERNDAEITEIVRELSGQLVQRNKGIDGLVTAKNQIVPFKVVKEIQDLSAAAELIGKSTKKNGFLNKAIYFKDLCSKSQMSLIEKKYDVVIFNNLKTLENKLKT